MALPPSTALAAVESPVWVVVVVHFSTPKTEKVVLTSRSAPS
ncbi:hypothetical protein OG596_30940 [Streptomyces sp. NBC_01102]|nr:hypothetical protein OG596_30940 [Streptomyces sp. NBC_01102]